MSTYRLDRLFAPRSVAIVGAAPRQDSVGRAVLRNLREAGFPGPIHVVNRRDKDVDGLQTVQAVDDLAAAPDLVVIAVRPDNVPSAVEAAARKGAPACAILTAGLGHGAGSLAQACQDAARVSGMRVVGPNCLGVMAPPNRLNATFAARMPRPGNLALISQSGAVAAGIVEWAAQRNVGLSALASIGDQLDVDFGDLLDYFALDHTVRAIFTYVESINDARKFMSAARAAARIKPVVVIKAGRHEQGARAAATHTGALAGSDAVYDAAFRRAGLLRVFGLDELFDAAGTLARVNFVAGRRLTILTNGGGLGVLAVDRLADLGGTLAALSPATQAKLDGVLPPTWSKANPIDIIGDAGAARYAAALEVILSDPQSDAVMVMNVPTALASATDIADAVAKLVSTRRSAEVRPKPVFAVWVGADRGASEIFDRAAIPHYPTEAEALRGFMHLVRHNEAIAALMETPPSMPGEFAPDAASARRVVDKCLADGRSRLDPLEMAELLRAYAIEAVPTTLARDEAEAEAAAAPYLDAGGAVVAKILSRDIVHKSDVDGVRLNLTTAAAVREATAAIIAAAHAARPDAEIAGVIIQPMIVRPKARELIVGIADDTTFGPVIVFGHGGIAVEVMDDKAIALPPLDLKLARDLIGRTRVSRLLRAYRRVPAVDETQLALVLVKLAQIAADLPEIRELDINPLLADEAGMIALDARAVVGAAPQRFKGPHKTGFAIRPYPSEWERHVVLPDGGKVFIRPVRAEDEALFLAFIPRVTAEDLRLRFFAPIRTFTHAFIARLTQLDYARAMAFIAIDEGNGDMLGVVRLHADANYENGEYAILVRSDLKGHGLGWTLMQLIIEYARATGLKRIEAQVLRENSVMLQMCRELGFEVKDDPEDPSLTLVSLVLATPA